MPITMLREGKGALSMRTYSTFPESPKLNTRPKRTPLRIDMSILTNISRYIMSLMSETGIPMALSILNSYASSLHFP